MKVRLLIEYDEAIEGDGALYWTTLQPVGFPVGPAYLVGILEMTKSLMLNPSDDEESTNEDDPQFEEFRRKLNALIDEFNDSL